MIDEIVGGVVGGAVEAIAEGVGAIAEGVAEAISEGVGAVAEGAGNDVVSGAVGDIGSAILVPDVPVDKRHRRHCCGCIFALLLVVVFGLAFYLLFF